MKLTNLFLLTSLLILSIACNKDDPCVVEDLQYTIIGKWTVNYPRISVGNVEFKPDGTLIDPSDALIGLYEGTGEKHYEVLSNSSFIATVEYNGSPSGSPIEVTSYTCDEIVLFRNSITFKLNRY